MGGHRGEAAIKKLAPSEYITQAAAVGPVEKTQAAGEDVAQPTRAQL